LTARGSGSQRARASTAGIAAYFSNVKAGQRLALGDVVKGRATGQLVVTVARPIEDRDGR